MSVAGVVRLKPATISSTKGRVRAVFSPPRRFYELAPKLNHYRSILQKAVDRLWSDIRDENSGGSWLPSAPDMASYRRKARMHERLDALEPILKRANSSEPLYTLVEEVEGAMKRLPRSVLRYLKQIETS